jgi:hypothetical protein
LSYLDQLKRLYIRLGQEATPESLQQAAMLTNHFAEKVTELLAVAAPAQGMQPQSQQLQLAGAPATPQRSLSVQSPGVAASPLAPVAPALSPKPVVTSGAVSSIPLPKAAGRKVRSSTKPKHDKSVKLTVETVTSGEEESDTEEMAANDGQPVVGADGGGTQAVGFTLAGATAAPP